MKKIKLLFIFFVLVVVCILFAACDTGCAHSWKPATCTSPKTCSLCQKTEGDIKEHDYKDGVCSMCQAVDPIKTQLGLGEKIFLGLNAINSGTSKQATTLYYAWKFAVYDANDYSPLWGGWTEAISDFASAIGIKKDVVVNAIDEYLKRRNETPDETSRYVTVSTISGAVGVVSIIYEKGEESTKNLLDTVKKMLKEMDEEYEKDTLYSTLKEYYNETVSFYDFVSSPSGSFAQLSSTINGYNSRLNNHVTELTFVYGD